MKIGVTPWAQRNGFPLCALPLRWTQRDRIAGLLCGLLITLAWFVALGYAPNLFWISPVVPWALCVLTVSSAIYLHRKLEAATEVAAQGRSELANGMAVALS